MTVVTRTAHCGCGALRVDADGEPAAVIVCHCSDCQRRTGSVMGVGAYFAKDMVKASGPAKAFTRTGRSGGAFTQYFCPDCGTALYWEAALRPGLVGVAVGGFGGTALPLPTRSVWEENKHGWVTLGADIPGHEQGSTTARTR